MMLPRNSVSPIPMYTTSGFDGATPIAPTELERIWPSVIGFHVCPPSTVFHAPPPTAPNQYSSGRDAEPPIAMERPPRIGPMLRHFMPRNWTESTGVGSAG